MIEKILESLLRALLSLQKLTMELGRLALKFLQRGKVALGRTQRALERRVV